MLFLPLIVLLLPAIFLALNLMAVVPPNVQYTDLAEQKAVSAYYEGTKNPGSTNPFPSSEIVIGASIQTTPVDMSGLNFQYNDNVAWKAANADQAIISTCDQLQAACGTTDINQLFAFLPQSSGSVSSLLSLNSSNSLDCSRSNSYGPYGLYLLQQSLAQSDTVDNSTGKTINLYYHKPQSGSGCFHEDIVSVQ